MKLADEVRSTHGRDGAIVLDIRAGQMFRLNVVGSRMLELVKQGLTAQEIADVISRDTDTPRQIVAGDLQEFLESLERNQLIEMG